MSSHLQYSSERTDRGLFSLQHSQLWSAGRSVCSALWLVSLVLGWSIRGHSLVLADSTQSWGCHQYNGWNTSHDLLPSCHVCVCCGIKSPEQEHVLFLPQVWQLFGAGWVASWEPCVVQNIHPSFLIHRNKNTNTTYVLKSQMLTFLSMSCVSGIQSLFKWLRRIWRFFEGERCLHLCWDVVYSSLCASNWLFKVKVNRSGEVYSLSGQRTWLRNSADTWQQFSISRDWSYFSDRWR